MATTAPQRKYLVLTAMIFAVAMMFIDQTIVAIAVPAIDRDLALSATGAQWIINGYLGIFFLGFATSSQIGGRVLDARGARPAAIAGSAITVAGFLLWARALPDAQLSTQWYWVAMTGAGIGLVLSPASTDALNRAPRGSYGEVTGVTQTVRYFSSSLGLAILGTLFVHRAGGGADFAQATQTVYRSMAGVMVACLVVAIFGMPHGRAIGDA
jgi:MFS family permease